MKTDESRLKTVELCGRIAVLAEFNKWVEIQDLLNQFRDDAWRQGMGDASEIVSSYHHACTTPQVRALFCKTILTAASEPSSSASAPATGA